jgi:hypothetical protein
MYVLHPHHQHASHGFQNAFRVPSGFALRVQIRHLAGEPAAEPVAEAREAIGIGCRCDTGQREPQLAGLLFEARRKGGAGG